MEEKLENEVFKITKIDENVLAGDANKLKLLMTSYAVIMEVQKAYIEEEINSKYEEQSVLEAELEQGTSDDIENTKAKINELTKEITILERAAFDFNLSHKRFMSLAMKALSLPEQNFQQLANNGYASSKGGTVYLSDLQQEFEKSQAALVDSNVKTAKEDGKKYVEKTDVFSSIDTDAIKQGLENALNEEEFFKVGDEYATYGDDIADNVDNENFEETVSTIAEDLKNNLDKENENDKSEKSNDAKLKTDIDETDFDSLLKEADEKEDSIAHEIDDEDDIFSRADSVGADFKPIFDTTNSKEEDNSLNHEQPDYIGDEFDFSDDPELQELEAQFQEAKGQYETYQTELREKDEQATKLTTERDIKAQTAQEKKQVADRIIETRRIEARNKRIEQLKAGLSDYKAKAIEAAALVDQTNKRIGVLDAEIANYQSSIEQSEKIIEEEEKRTKK